MSSLSGPAANLSILPLWRPPSVMQGLNDVTNKVAYAYARYQASLVVVAALVVGGLLATYDELDVPLSVVDDLLLAVLGAALLVVALRNRDLKRINRGALLLLSAAFLLQLVFAFLESPEDRLDESVWIAALALLLLAHFLPRRMGKTVLFGQGELRALSNGRTLATGLLFALVFSGLGEAVLGIPPRSVLGVFDLLVAIACTSGLVVYLLFPSGPRLTGWLSGFAGVSLVVAASAAASTFKPGDRLDEQLVALVALASALVVVWGFSRRINQGKTIIAHRA